MNYSEQFQPQSYSQASQQRYGRPKQQQKYISGEKNGKWSEKQNTQYIAYIEYHKDKMRSKQKRRVNKLYKEMARFIGTRNALQCRSHHQKLQDRYLYPNKIIANFKQHNDLTLFFEVKQELQEYESKLANAQLPDLKLQEKNLEHPTEVDLRVLEQNQVHASQDGSNSEPSREVVGNQWMINSATLISVDVYQGLPIVGPLFYYPFYHIF